MFDIASAATMLENGVNAIYTFDERSSKMPRLVAVTPSGIRTGLPVELHLALADHSSLCPRLLAFGAPASPFLSASASAASRVRT